MVDIFLRGSIFICIIGFSWKGEVSTVTMFITRNFLLKKKPLLAFVTQQVCFSATQRRKTVIDQLQIWTHTQMSCIVSFCFVFWGFYTTLFLAIWHTCVQFGENQNQVQNTLFLFCWSNRGDYEEALSPGGINNKIQMPN